jgi:hypothetical protein
VPFRIGHPAYTGVNSAVNGLESKGQAVKALRDKGVRRDDARAAVQAAFMGHFAVVRGGPLGDDVVEVIYREEGGG